MQPQANTGDSTVSSGNQFLSFRLGDEAYGIDILRVQEIRGWESVRPLPDAPAHVKGVLDLRGIIVPIIDLRIRFGDPQPQYQATTVVIIVAVSHADGGQQLMGMVVDGVSDVLQASDAEIKSPPRIAGGIKQSYLQGMVSLDRGMVVLIDIDKMLSQSELAELEELGSG